MALRRKNDTDEHGEDSPVIEDSIPNEDIPDDLETKVNDALGYAQATYETMSTMLDKFTALEAKFGTLITVLGNNVGIQQGSQEDLDDMVTIINGQNNIIQALVSHEGLSDISRENLGVVLSEIEDFTAIEDAKQRIAERRKQREVLSGQEED